DWQLLRSGALRLQVRGRWLDPPWVKVAWPPPTASPTTLSLYLWLHSINTDISNRTAGIDVRHLCERVLGQAIWGRNRALAELHHAQRAVNGYLHWLDRDALGAQHCYPPAEYEIHGRAGSKSIRFVAMRWERSEGMEPEQLELAEVEQ